MDRRRHARTPVDINAMLIGQKTVPKGCRVRNVSQQGMLLQCEPDGRLHLEGIGALGSLPEAQATKVLPRSLRLVDTRLVWIDRKTETPPLILADVAIALRRVDQRLEAPPARARAGGAAAAVAKRQRVVEVDGVNLRQRYNTNGSLTWGAEAAVTRYLAEALRPTRSSTTWRPTSTSCP